MPLPEAVSGRQRDFQAASDLGHGHAASEPEQRRAENLCVVRTGIDGTERCGDREERPAADPAVRQGRVVVQPLPDVPGGGGHEVRVAARGADPTRQARPYDLREFEGLGRRKHLVVSRGIVRVEPEGSTDLPLHRAPRQPGRAAESGEVECGAELVRTRPVGDPRPDDVVVDVPDDGREVLVELDGRRVVSPLEQPAVPIVPAVEASRVVALDPLHGGRQLPD
ncbi:MAG: hypothetical protein ACF8XB_22570, partial [Planctomycetota bacterium JB042]